MTTEQARAELKARKGTWMRIADATGISYSWITKFGAGRFTSPGALQIEALEAYFRDHPRPLARESGAA